MGWFFLVIFIGLVVFLIFAIRIVEEEERWVIELLGSYFRTWQPGFHLLIPGLMKVRAVERIWEQSIPLFEKKKRKEEEIKIDFKDGSAIPGGAEAFVRIKNPDTKYEAGDGKEKTGVYRAVYEVGNWKVATRDLLENAIGSYLRGLKLDTGIRMTGGGAGFDLQDRLPEEEKERIREINDRRGIELLQITIQDFDLDPDLVKARGEVQKRQREADAATHERKKRARETMGSLVQMMAEATGANIREIREEINGKEELKERFQGFAQDLVSRQMSIDGKALTDIRVGGGGDLEQTILRLIGAFKSKLGG